MNIEKDIWKEFIQGLGERMDQDVSTLDGLLSALEKSHNYFDETDVLLVTMDFLSHTVIMYVRIGLSRSTRKPLPEKKLKPEEVKDFKAYMLHQFGALNREAGWTMQLHIGAVRDYRDSIYEVVRC